MGVSISGAACKFGSTNDGRCSPDESVWFQATATAGRRHDSDFTPRLPSTLLSWLATARSVRCCHTHAIPWFPRALMHPLQGQRQSEHRLGNGEAAMLWNDEMFLARANVFSRPPQLVAHPFHVKIAVSCFDATSQKV